MLLSHSRAILVHRGDSPKPKHKRLPEITDGVCAFSHDKHSFGDKGLAAGIAGSLNVIILSPQHFRTILKRSFYVRRVTYRGWSIKVLGKQLVEFF